MRLLPAILLSGPLALAAEPSPEAVVAVAAERVLPYSETVLSEGYSLEMANPRGLGAGSILLMVPATGLPAVEGRLSLLRELPSPHLPVYEFRDRFGGIWRAGVRLDGKSIRIAPIHAGYLLVGPGGAQVRLIRNEEELAAALREHIPTRAGEEPLTVTRVLAAAAAQTRQEATPEGAKKKHLERRIRQIKEELLEEKEKQGPAIPPEVPKPDAKP